MVLGINHNESKSYILTQLIRLQNT